MLDLYDYWAENPCVRDMVAGYLGVEGKKTNRGSFDRHQEDSDDPSGIGGLVAMFPDGRVPGHM